MFGVPVWGARLKANTVLVVDIGITPFIMWLVTGNLSVPVLRASPLALRRLAVLGGKP
jgi:hypothetical protein